MSSTCFRSRSTFSHSALCRFTSCLTHMHTYYTLHMHKRTHQHSLINTHAQNGVRARPHSDTSMHTHTIPGQGKFYPRNQAVVINSFVDNKSMGCLCEFSCFLFFIYSSWVWVSVSTTTVEHVHIEFCFCFNVFACKWIALWHHMDKSHIHTTSCIAAVWNVAKKKKKSKIISLTHLYTINLGDNER